MCEDLICGALHPGAGPRLGSTWGWPSRGPMYARLASHAVGCGRAAIYYGASHVPKGGCVLEACDGHGLRRPMAGGMCFELPAITKAVSPDNYCGLELNWHLRPHKSYSDHEEADDGQWR